MPKLFVKGIDKNSTSEDLKKTVADVFLKSTDNLAWLKAGDKVLLKPAVNSPDPYPSTSHPFLISVLRAEIEKRGGQVIVGDQSGVEHVVHNQQGVVKGSSALNFEKAGMGKADEFTGFETLSWEKGFFLFKNQNTKAWPDGYYVTKIIKDVDHIINLTRLSTHGQAGVTAAFKNLVGIIRLDSRLEFHNNGPFNMAIKHNARPSELKIPNDKMDSFFEKITEIFESVKEKMRLNICVGTQAQVTIGPDRHTVKTPFIKISSFQVSPPTGLVFATADPVAHEVFSTALLSYLYQTAPLNQKIIQKILVLLNGQIKELGAYRPWDSPFARHALKLRYGSGRIDIDYSDVPAKLQNNLNKLLIK